jgi:predicted DNA-binding transcriptional regulator AlpA
MSHNHRRPAAIRFLKYKPQQVTLLPLALENIVIEEPGEAGAVIRRAPRLEEVEAALKSYFAAVDVAPDVETATAPPRVMRVKEAAQALGIAVVTVRLWMRLGRLRKVQLSPGAVGVCADDVAAFIAKARGA